MKIAQIAPLFESVPPKYYGGTERIVSYLTEALVQLGHEVTLFASGDSVTKAELRPQVAHSLRLDKECIDQLAHQMLMVEHLSKCSDEFEIIHSHIDYLPFSMFRRIKTKHLTTLHGRLDISDLKSVYMEFSEMPVVSISDSQRKPLPWINWQSTVYHGIPADLYQLHEKRGNYLAFIGRTSPEKRLDCAIEIAKKAEMPLKIAAKVDNVDKIYFDAVIKPLLDHPLIEYIGEIGDSDKNEFLGNAAVLLFPIEWPEPFGLVMIEAMACGTPVIAFNYGSVPEVIDPGKTGLIVNNVAEAVRAVKQLGTISRKGCREVFEKRFTSIRMAEDYLKIYQQLIETQEMPNISTETKTLWATK